MWIYHPALTFTLKISEVSSRVTPEQLCGTKSLLSLGTSVVSVPGYHSDETSQDTQGCLSLIFSDCAVRQNVTSWRSQQFVGAMECDCSG